MCDKKIKLDWICNDMKEQGIELPDWCSKETLGHGDALPTEIYNGEHLWADDLLKILSGLELSDGTPTGWAPPSSCPKPMA